jgi:methylated-DNA-[protein]-cysteine S-methyltransferase
MRATEASLLPPNGRANGRARSDDLPARSDVTPVLAQATGQLEAFFAGELRVFSTPLGFEVGTPFYRDVWAALLEIPFGQRTSYGALARALGRPGAARAVGSAVARNPLSLFVPCHRVVGGGGQLTGFAGGLPAKQWLLQHEA